MKGYSFRSLTDLVLKIFKTKVNAGTGLSGGGSLEADRTLTVKYGTAAGTAAQGNDSRVVNALQKGNNLSDTTDKTLARGNLGLGTAATKDVGEGVGQVMPVGAFGVGHTFPLAVFDANEIANQVGNKSGFYPYISNIGSSNTPYLFVYINQLFFADGDLSGLIQIAYGFNADTSWIRTRLQGVWTPWSKQLSTNDIGEAAGQVMAVGTFGFGAQNTNNASYDVNDLPAGQRISLDGITEVIATERNLPALGGSDTAPRSWHVECVGRGTTRLVQTATEVFGSGTFKGRTFTRVKHDAIWSPWQEVYKSNHIVETTGTSSTNIMSQKATTDHLATKAGNSTQVIAGTGLTGGGSLVANRTLNVSYGTTAGTSAQGNDDRLNNSREWSSATISQAEAEAGVLTTRRAFTAQRVRQAIVAWWNGITSTFGRDLVTSANNSAARDKLGLFTSALRWPTWAEVTGKPTTFSPSSHTHPWSQVTEQPATATRWPTLEEVTGRPANYPTNWATVGDKPVVQTVGTSTTNLMSQKAITDAINNNSIGVGQTWQDVTDSRAAGTTYTNTTGRTIIISPTTRDNAVAGALGISVYVNGDLVSEFTGVSSSSGTRGRVSLATVVPPNATYRCEITLNDSLVNWLELR